jgi:hypothetical protein
MALTAESVQRLGNVSLIKFFNDRRALYLAKAEKAYAYAAEYVTASGERVRVDDVAAPLVLALKVGDPLITCLAEKKLIQGYWYGMFADYILDQVWEELAK